MAKNEDKVRRPAQAEFVGKGFNTKTRKAVEEAAGKYQHALDNHKAWADDCKATRYSLVVAMRRFKLADYRMRDGRTVHVSVGPDRVKIEKPAVEKQKMKAEKTPRGKQLDRERKARKARTKVPAAESESLH